MEHQHAVRNRRVRLLHSSHNMVIRRQLCLGGNVQQLSIKRLKKGEGDYGNIRISSILDNGCVLCVKDIDHRSIAVSKKLKYQSRTRYCRYDLKASLYPMGGLSLVGGMTHPLHTPIKTKKCKICKEPFPLFKSTQQACSISCAQKLVQLAKDKKHRKELREGRERLKTKSDLLKEAQRAFNKYIRIRDKDKPCISCGRFHDGQYHAGHLYSVGAHPEKRFNEDNVAKQCRPCNEFLSGNALEYRKNLIERIGVDRVEALEADNEPKHYTTEQIISIKKHYANKARELERT